MFAVCIWALLLRQHTLMKPKAEITWDFLRSSLSIFCLFSNGMPPTQGSNHPFGCSPLASNLYSTIGVIYIFALCCISSWHLSGNSFNAMQREGCGRGMELGGISHYRCGWHHLPSFLLAGQQNLFSPNEMNALSHLLGFSNEARSVRWPESAIYIPIHATPKFRLFLSVECKKKQKMFM